MTRQNIVFYTSGAERGRRRRFFNLHCLLGYCKVSRRSALFTQQDRMRANASLQKFGHQFRKMTTYWRKLNRQRSLASHMLHLGTPHFISDRIISHAFQSTCFPFIRPRPAIKSRLPRSLAPFAGQLRKRHIHFHEFSLSLWSQCRAGYSRVMRGSAVARNDPKIAFLATE